MSKKEAKKIIKEIAKDIDEKHGGNPHDRRKWVAAYAWWNDCVECLGVGEASTKLLEA